MRIGFTIFCGFLVLGWLAMLVASVHGFSSAPLAALAAQFMGDFAHPWRGLINLDLSIHLALLAGWMVYRAASWPAGLACAALALLFGGAFTLGYLLVVTVRARGDMRLVMLGSNATASERASAG